MYLESCLYFNRFLPVIDILLGGLKITLFNTAFKEILKKYIDSYAKSTNAYRVLNKIFLSYNLSYYIYYC